MGMLLVACFAVAIPFVGAGLFGLQNRLEFWTQQRHEKD